MDDLDNSIQEFNTILDHGIIDGVLVSDSQCWVNIALVRNPIAVIYDDIETSFHIR